MKEPRQSFDIDGCRAMLGKLRHELELCRSDDRKYLSGHLVNFAMTAYHLIEWTWEDLAHQPLTKDRLATTLGLPVDQFGPRTFCKYVMQTCPGMDVCQAIANGTKHVAYDDSRSVRVIETFVSAGPSYAVSNASNGRHSNDVVEDVEPTASPVFQGTPKVVVDGIKSGDVRDTFEHVAQWWTEFIYGHNIDRFNEESEG